MYSKLQHSKEIGRQRHPKLIRKPSFKEVQRDAEAWVETGLSLFTVVLYEMSQALGYDFDEVQLKRDCYSPVAHGNIEEQQANIRKGIEEVLSGYRSIQWVRKHFGDLRSFSKKVQPVMRSL